MRQRITDCFHGSLLYADSIRTLLAHFHVVKGVFRARVPYRALPMIVLLSRRVRSRHLPATVENEPAVLYSHTAH